MSAAPLALALLAPLDALRRAALRPLGPWLGRYYRDRALRVTLLGALSVTVALALTAAAPLWLLALGPLALGVPHLAADARYLVARQGLHRRAAVIALVLAPALVASWRADLAWVFAPALGAALCARAPSWRRALVALAAVSLYLVARNHERGAWLVIAHGHNAVALGVWWWWSRPPRGARALVVAAVLLCVTVIFAGGLDALALRPFATRAPAAGIDLATLADTLSPVAPARDPIMALRWVLAFAFGQCVHYALWLRLVPEEDRARPAPRTFAGSATALTRDLGGVATTVTVVAALGLVAWALRDLAAARDAYLRLAAGHGGIELGALSLLACERSLRREGA